MVILALVLLIGAGYAQYMLPLYTRGQRRVIATRLLLIIAGVAFDLAGARQMHGYPAQLLAFLTGIGLVHLPAAIILFIKSRRGAGKS